MSSPQPLRPDIAEQAGRLRPDMAAQAGRRLAWLDALRGVGAMAVLLEHMLYRFLPELRPYWMNLGIYGVMVFFLVSGYVIPASLEGKGDVRRFWLGRLFRLYPLYLLVIGIVLLSVPLVPLRRGVGGDPETVAAHVTMLIDLVWTPGFGETMWTLSYEMAFYLLITTLFVGGLHRRSGLFAVLFAVAALAVGLLLVRPLTAVVPAALWSSGVMAAGLALVLLGRGWVRAAGAVVVGALAVVPFFAARAGWWADPPVWLATMALVAATFALGMAWRHRRVPRALVRLGLISYSVYLLHHPLMKLFLAVYGDPRREPLLLQAVLAVAYISVVLGLSWVTYHLVEGPMQKLGRRLARALPGTPRETRGREPAPAGNLG